MRPIHSQVYGLTHRYREQARSHRFCGWLEIGVVAQINVGARLAREGTGTFTIAIARHTAIASKLCSHRFCDWQKIGPLHQSMWERACSR